MNREVAQDFHADWCADGKNGQMYRCERSPDDCEMYRDIITALTTTEQRADKRAAEWVRKLCADMRHIELVECDCNILYPSLNCPSLMPRAVERHDSRLGDTRGCWRCALEKIAAQLEATVTAMEEE